VLWPTIAAALVAFAAAWGVSAASADAAPVVVENDATPAQQFDVTDSGGVVDELHAHGGGMIRSGGHYYWFGEWRNGDGTINRVPVYRSSDLKSWEYRGVALAASEVAHLTQPNIERPKVIYNASTDQYVMWMHLETNGNYNRAEAAVGIADDVEGPYTWVDSFRPNVAVTNDNPNHTPGGAPPHMSRDITAFVDDDGTAYMISAADDNTDLHIYRLNADYTGFAAGGHYSVWNDQWREAPILIKRNGVYFLLTSGATGWAPNQQQYATATSMAGPWTQPTSLPFGNGSAFETQGAHAIAIQGTETTSYLYLADRWGGSFGTSVMSSKYVWLPLSFPTETSIDMEWADSVQIDTETGEVEGIVNDPPAGHELAIENLAVGSTSASAPHPFLHGAGLNSAANMLDGRDETAWVSANTLDTSWAQLDLGSVQTLDTVRLMLYRGGIRSHPIEISVGETPESLEPVWSGSTQMRTGFQDFEFDPTEGRYVRVRLTGPGTGDTNAGIPPGNSFGLVEAEVYDASGEASECPPLRSDDFEGDALDTQRWDFTHPTTPGAGEDAPAVVDGELRMRTLPGEIDNAGAGPISFVGQPLPPGDHWTVTAKVRLAQAAGWQHAGLMLWVSDENFIRLNFTRNNSGAQTGQRFFELVTESGNTRVQSPQTSMSASHPDTVWVRMTRVGNEIVARFSTTGASFTSNAGIWLPRDQGSLNTFHGATGRSLTGRTGPEARIGPYTAGGTAGGPNPLAAFESIEIAPDAEGECEQADATPPTTTAQLNGGDPLPTYEEPVELTLQADDGPEGSGVDYTEYRLDGGEWTLYDPLFPPSFSATGDHEIEYRSVDLAGNAEEPNSIAFAIEEPDVGSAALDLAVKPKAKRVKVGNRATFTATTTNTGDAHASEVEVCARAPAKKAKIVGKACATAATLEPQASFAPRFTLKPKRAARGKQVKVTFKATSPGAEAARATAVLKVRR
jgi:hypothetical protein